MANNNGYLPFPKGFATAAIHTGQNPEKWDSSCVVPPIIVSTTFKQQNPAAPTKYIYGRLANPTRTVLEECLAKLEGGKYGLCFASGLGATSILLHLFQTGDHILCANDIYGGTTRLFKKIGSPLGILTTLVDVLDLKEVERNILPNTKMLWIETPTNPLLKVVDIRAVAEITKKNNILLVVDNTFLTPYLQRPLELGADIVTHSLTKYLNGHSDVVMGAILLNDETVFQKLRFLQYAMGIVPSPIDCYQVTRSLKTLDIRMKKHGYNSLAVAEYLENHPKIVKVIHPGLQSHPQHELSKRQTSGNSGMLSMYIRGGLEESELFLANLKIFTVGDSLGGPESLAELPSTMTHNAVPKNRLAELKITDNLIRLSVGLENVEDLIADLDEALKNI